MLELRNVSAANRGITQLNFSVAAGEIVALIGRNGAGKTTLLRLALGLIHPTAGTVRRTVGNGDIGQLIDAATVAALHNVGAGARASITRC